MIIAPVPPAHEIVRFYSKTHQGRVDAFVRYWTGSPLPWSFEPVRRLAKIAYGHEMPLSSLIRTAGMRAGPGGKEHNEEAIEAIYNHGKGTSVHCYGLPSASPLYIRKDLAIRGEAHFYYVEDRAVRVVFVQPRRTFIPEMGQFGILTAILRKTALTTDFQKRDAEIEILDLSCRSGAKRVCRTLGSSDLPIVSDAELESILEQIAVAYDEARLRVDWAALAARRQADNERRRARTQKAPDAEMQLF